MKATFFGTLILCGSVFGLENEIAHYPFQKELCPQSQLVFANREDTSSYFIILDAIRKDGEAITLKLEGKNSEDLQSFLTTVEKRLKLLMGKPGEAELAKLSWIVVGSINETRLTKELTDASALWLLVNADFKDYSSFTSNVAGQSIFIFECSTQSKEKNDLASFWKKQMASDALEARLLSRAERMGAAVSVKQHALLDELFTFANLESKESDLEKLGTLFLELEFAKQKGLSSKECSNVKQFYINWLQQQKNLLKIKENETLARVYRFFCGTKTSEDAEKRIQDSLDLLETFDDKDLEKELNQELASLSYQVRLSEAANPFEQQELAHMLEAFSHVMEGWKKDQTKSEFADKKSGLEESPSKFARDFSKESITIDFCKIVVGDDGLEYDDGEVEDTFNDIDPYLLLPLHQKDKKNINKIISSMAEKSWAELWNDEKELKRAGDQVNHVHPMRFIGYIFADPYLKACMGRIYNSSISLKWNKFIKGYAGRMKEEASRNNLEKFVPGFSRMVNADPEKVMEYIQARDYEGLVIYLL